MGSVIFLHFITRIIMLLTLIGFLYYFRKTKVLKYFIIIIIIIYSYNDFYNSASLSQKISYFRGSKNVETTTIKDISYCINDKTCYSTQNRELIKNTVFFLKNTKSVYFPNKLNTEKGVLTLNTENGIYNYRVWNDINKNIFLTLYMDDMDIVTLKNIQVSYILDKIKNKKNLKNNVKKQ